MSVAEYSNSNLKPDTHDETLSTTFVYNFCLQLLCVSYTTVQTMKLLYGTSHYLLLFPMYATVYLLLKASLTLSTGSPSSPSCGNFLRIYSTETLLVAT